MYEQMKTYVNNLYNRSEKQLEQTLKTKKSDIKTPWASLSVGARENFKCLFLGCLSIFSHFILLPKQFFIEN